MYGSCFWTTELWRYYKNTYIATKFSHGLVFPPKYFGDYVCLWIFSFCIIDSGRWYRFDIINCVVLSRNDFVRFFSRVENVLYIHNSINKFLSFHLCAFPLYYYYCDWNSLCEGMWMFSFSQRDEGRTRALEKINFPKENVGRKEASRLTHCLLLYFDIFILQISNIELFVGCGTCSRSLFMLSASYNMYQLRFH